MKLYSAGAVIVSTHRSQKVLIFAQTAVQRGSKSLISRLLVDSLRSHAGLTENPVVHVRSEVTARKPGHESG